MSDSTESRGRWSRQVAPALLVALLLATAVTFVISRRLLQDQEDRLLAERTDEVAALLKTSFASIESSLRVLGAVGDSKDQAATRLFAESAQPMIRGNTVTVGVARSRGDGFDVVTTVGDGPRAGEPLPTDRAQVAARALATKKFVTGLLGDGQGGARLVMAVPVGSSGAVAYQESKLTPKVPSPSTPESPFRELRVALYASHTNDPARLVVTTEAEVPLRGNVERIPFAVGADTWLLAVGARGSLVGSFARNFPWLLLGGGVVMSLLAATAVEVFARRRGYALALVAQRTSELEGALSDLAQVRSFLDHLLTAGPVLVRRVTVPDRQISYVSPNIERLFGVTEEQALTPGFLGSMVHPDDRDLFEGALDRVADGSSAREEIEYRLGSKDGPSQWVSATLVPEADVEGRIVAVLGYVIDVDDRRRADQARREAQEAAETANRSKSEFLSRMSHELRTPLNAVLGFGQVLELEELTDDQRESVGHILKGGRHLLGLINEVLDISRIEAGELALSPEAVLASALIMEAADLMRPLAEQRGIQLVMDRSHQCDCYVFADRQRAKQILLNLLSNAIKYNRARGTVAISCERPSDTRFRISVADTGNGIAAERLGLLFTPFERLGAEETEEEGTGIGLALSRRLAEAMGGQLDATSVLGQGSTFTVELPLVEGPVERYERLEDRGEEAPAPANQRHRVLHIEDNPANLKLVERVFAQRENVEVIAAMYGRLGLELAHEHRPVLILLDLHLPDMGGGQVLQRLRDDPVTASIPVAVVSADATQGQVQRLLAAGASAYLTKPIDVRELLGVLDDALAR
jgi:PAS domain S-box-containing protein